MPQMAWMKETPRGFAIFFLDAAPRPFLVELHLATEKIVRVQVAQQEVRIGHAGVRASPPVADGSGRRSGTFRPDLKRAHLAYLRDAAAPCTYLHQVDDRHLDQ